MKTTRSYIPVPVSSESAILNLGGYWREQEHFPMQRPKNCSGSWKITISTATILWRRTKPAVKFIPMFWIFIIIFVYMLWLLLLLLLNVLWLYLLLYIKNENEIKGFLNFIFHGHKNCVNLYCSFWNYIL